MNAKEYIESGILELYVLGQLSPKEVEEVEAMQSKYAEIQREIYEISLTLEKYGQLNSLKAPKSIESKVFENLPPKTPTNGSNIHKPTSGNGGLSWNLLSTLFALLAVLGFTMYFIQKSDHQSELNKYEASLKSCDSLMNAKQTEYAVLDQINRPDNKIINLQATPNYGGISVYLHYNEVDKKNFLQLVNLPAISEDQVFQLWSLRDGENPMPLDVFVNKNSIIPVAFIDKTTTYAITIEPKGGSKVPSLDKLIGTIGV